MFPSNCLACRMWVLFSGCFVMFLYYVVYICVQINVNCQNNGWESDKLSFTEAHELELLPEKIESKELELEAVDAQIADPSLYSKSADEIKAVNQKRTVVQEELDALYERFELLLSKSEG